MEPHSEQISECARLELRKKIQSEYSKFGYDLYGLAYELLDMGLSDDLLDVGCGLGDFLINVRSRGHLGKLVGIDLSPEVVEKAKKLADSEAAWIDFRLGNAESMEFPSASFDCVAALHVLGNADPSRILAEIGRVIKADGQVAISTNSRATYPLLQTLKEKARERFGWFLANEWTEGFESEIAVDILRRFFGEVEEFRYEDVLQYPDAEILVQFFRSSRGIWSETLSEAAWERIVDWARDQALELIPERGYAEDPKCFSLFRCARPLGL
jgi:ubiquinone/menaquinone biosynthesis C-methylase UbiE